MSSYFGDYPLNAVVRIPWNSSASDGASITRSTNGTMRIYKNNSTTQRTSLNGVTDSEDFDGIVGTMHVNIDLSDNTDAGFYAADNDYHVMLEGATIDVKVVNAWVGSFSIHNRVKTGPRRGVAFTAFQFFLAAEDGTPLAGKVDGDFDVKRYSIDGAADVAVSGTITEVDTSLPGFYKVTLTAAELDGGNIAFLFHATGSLHTPVSIFPAQ